MQFPTRRIEQDKRGRICNADLVGVLGMDTLRLAGWRWQDWVVTATERAFGNYESGRRALLFANIRALPEPIPARGMPGLWDWGGGAR